MTSPSNPIAFPSSATADAQSMFDYTKGEVGIAWGKWNLFSTKATESYKIAYDRQINA